MREIKINTSDDSCQCGGECKDASLYGISQNSSSSLKDRALMLSYITLGYNIIEGVMSILAGLLANSVALVGFGLDSFMESMSGGIMIWRFRNHKNMSHAEEERLEKKAVKLVGYAFYLFGTYVAYESIEKLLNAKIPEPSLFGIIIAAVSLITMPTLYYFKYKTGSELKSRSLIADSKQTLTCMFLSVALLVGLGFNYLWGVWWADPAVGLLVVFYLFKEGYSALKEESLCSC